MKKMFLFAIGLVFIVGCAKTKLVVKSPHQVFTGTYPTIDVRNMWQSCMQGHQTARQFPPQIAFLICDCVTDTTRRDIEQPVIKAVYTDNDTVAQEEQVKYWAKTNAVCQVDIMNAIGKQQGKGVFVPPTGEDQEIKLTPEKML